MRSHARRGRPLTTAQLITLIVLIAVTATLVGVIRVQNERHRRLRKRLEALERRAAEIVQAVKPTYTARVDAQLAGASTKPRFAPIFRSQFGEDLFLFELFNLDPAKPSSGYYIECGAYDGWTYAVTAVFDAMGWDGLLVEALPSLAEACRKSRPNARVVQAALSKRGSSGTATFTHLTDSENRYDASSFLADARDARRTKAPPMRHATSVDVPLTTMDAVLEAQPPRNGRVDLAVIDVEGAELSLLDGFDLAKWKPRVILIEDHSLGRDPTLRDYLGERGYEHITWISYNRLMIRRDEPALIQRARDIAQHTATAKPIG